MSVLLFILGLLAVGAGGGMVAFGIPINEFGLGSTLILAGVTAVTGGLVLIGLAAAVSQLRKIADAVTTRPVPRAMRPNDPYEPHVPGGARPAPRIPLPRRPAASEGSGPEPRSGDPRVAVPSVTVSAEAIDRLRATFPRIDRSAAEETEREDDTPLSPRAPAPKVPAPALRPVPADAAGEVRADAPSAMATEDVTATPKPRLDFPWRSKPRADATAPKAATATEEFDQLWPPSSPPAPTADAPAIQPNGDRTAPAVVAPRKAPAPAAPTDAAPPAPVAILKSGVVDGMAYTLYADGSIEAKLPEGTVRFGSIAELRSHLETHENQT